MIAYTTYIHDGRVKRHAESLAERGDHVDVICLDHEQQPPVIAGVNIIGLQMPRYRGASRAAYLLSYFRFFAMATKRAFQMSLKDRYDVVIVCTMPDAVVVTAILPKLLGSKVVLDVHDTMPELYRDKFSGRRGAIGSRLMMLEERMSAFWADRVLAVHDLHRDRLQQAGIPHHKLRVVTNTPDPRIFTPHSKVAEASEGFTIACHGTLTQRMGLDLAINAIAMLRDRYPELRLLMIGNGDYAPQAQALVERLKVSDRVRFEKAVPVERLPEMLAAAKIGIVPNMPSSATHLMLPVKMLDYATLGIPVIASRLRTVEHYFGDGAVEFFEPGSAEDLARAIEHLYLNPAVRAELVTRGRLALERLGWDAQRAEYINVIDSLMTTPSRVRTLGLKQERL
jgi:glycosyltransferase involved in cell wall biosynthesis